jgi:hypothetical protein
MRRAMAAAAVQASDRAPAFRRVPLGEGRGSQTLAKALIETARRVDQLNEEVDSLRRSRDKIFPLPPIEWIKDRVNNIQQVLEQRTARSAQTLRSHFGPIRLELHPGYGCRPSDRPVDARSR